MIVYIDQIFVINLFADFVLVHIVSCLISDRKLKYSVVAAVVGALYATVVYIPGVEFFSGIIIKIIVFIVMSVIVLRPKSITMFFKGIAVFAAVSAFFGGAVFVVLYMSGFTVLELKNNSIAVFDASTSVLMLAFCCVALVGYCIIRLVYKEISINMKTVNLEIRHNGRRININGILDTGCTLSEPEKNRPVVIIDSKYGDAMLREVGNVFMIPYSTVDNNGVFLGFYPDYLKVGKKILKNIAVAVCYSDVMKEKQYSAIINSDVLKEENYIA